MNIGGIITAILAGVFMGTMGVFSRKTGLEAEVITFFSAPFRRRIFNSPYGPYPPHPAALVLWPTWPVLIHVLMLAGFIIFYVQAMYLTTMVNSIMIVYLAPLVTSIYAHFFLGEKLNSLQLPGCLLIILSGAIKEYLTAQAAPLQKLDIRPQVSPLKSNSL